ncbi:MAG: hypothetical protein KKB50_12385 [Planctomycetes bacterium]|nr:hypothetical protein [Planctomycetota bacterium]
MTWQDSILTHDDNGTSAFARTPGFEGLRLDVVDDLALGQMLKQHGVRTGVVNGLGCVGVRWCESMRDMARGAEKAALASFAAFSMVRLTVICLVLLMLELAPFVGLFVFGRPVLQSVAAGAIVCALVAQLIPSIWFGRPWWPIPFAPLATILAVAIMLRAGLLAVWRGGLLWRGTLYPTEMLRRGARLRFPGRPADNGLLRQTSAHANRSARARSAVHHYRERPRTETDNRPRRRSSAFPLPRNSWLTSGLWLRVASLFRATDSGPGD